MSSACPQCGSTAWKVTEFSGCEECAVETRECENGHEWTEVLEA